MRKNYAISRNDQTEFDGTVSHLNLWYIVEQNSGQISAPSTQTINGKVYNFANWTDNIYATNPRTISPTDNQTYTALYKVIHKSNDASAFSNNSQRKLVKTRDNWLHQVYTSMGHVWLEHSTNNGSTWFLGNNGQPIDNGAGKCPSIDWHYNTSDPNDPNYNAVVVVYQQQSGSTYKIEYAIFKYTNGSYVRQGQDFQDRFIQNLQEEISMPQLMQIRILHGEGRCRLLCLKL